MYQGGVGSQELMVNGGVASLSEKELLGVEGKRSPRILA